MEASTGQPTERSIAGGKPSDRAWRKRRGTPTRARSALTLIEILVVLGVVAVLLAILLPALSAVRLRARESASVANLRTIGETFSLYEKTYGALPFGTWGPAFPPSTGERFMYAFDIWLIHSAWPVFMHEVAPWPEHAQAWVSPGAANPNRFAKTWGEPGPNISSFTPQLVSYDYSTAFVAAPALWDGRSEADESLVRPRSFSDVSFPSAKVLAFDDERAYLPADQSDSPQRPVLLADGSAGVRSDRDAAEPVDNPLSEYDPEIYHDTPDGLNGRDF